MKVKPSVIIQSLYGSAGGVQIRRSGPRFVAERRRVAIPPSTWPADWLTGWHRRYPITIAAGKVTADLTDFILLVEVTSSELFDHADPAGADLRVTAADGRTLLDIELDSYVLHIDEATAWLWVRIPSLPTASPTTLYLYFDNATAGPVDLPELTWPTEYRAVHHCRPGVVDSTSYCNDATVDTSTTVQGVIMQGRQCTYQRIRIPSHASLQLPATYTIEAWAKQFANGTYVYAPLRGAHWLTDGPGITLYSDRVRAGAGGSYLYEYIPSFDWTQWYHLALVVTSSSSTLFLNGAQLKTTATLLTPPTASTDLGLTCPGEGTGWGQGSVDEVRLIAAPLPPAHIAADYATQFAPLDFFSLRTLETYP